MVKAVDKLVLRQSSHLGGGKGFLYLRPAGVILRGFQLDNPPSGARFWYFAQPLIERIDFLHLGYGEIIGEARRELVLTHDPIRLKFKRESNNELAAAYASAISSFDLEANASTPERIFEQAMSLRSVSLGYRKTAAFLALFLGDHEWARQELLFLRASIAAGSRGPEFIGDVETLLVRIEEGDQAVGEQFRTWEADSRLRWGIDPR